MPKSMRLLFVSMLILCCCVSVAFAIEQPQTNDHARNLNQVISADNQDRDRDGSCDGDQDRDRDGSCQPILTNPDGWMIIADDQDRDQDQDKDQDQDRDGSC